MRERGTLPLGTMAHKLNAFTNTKEKIISNGCIFFLVFNV